MDKRELTSNVSVAFLAQGIAMGLSVLQTLLVPKILGIEQYGYWQLFIFYTSYVGVAPLGLVDGVYLINGGKSRDQIDKKAIYSQMLFGLSFESLIALAIVAVALFGGFGEERELVIMCTAIYLLVTNVSGYIRYVYQAMNETKRASYAQIVERLIFLIPLMTLLVLHVQSFTPYVYSYLFSSFVQLCYCLFFFRDFVGSGLEKFPVAARQAYESMRCGIKLMLANIAGTLILGIARFLIDVTWGIETFGELSLALSLVNFFLAFVNQASMVLFPALRQAQQGEVASFFRIARDTLELLFPVVYLLYYPMVWILSLWLPEYADSFVFFAFLLPICVFDSKMSIACTTFFKVRREEGLLLKINLATVALSAIGSLAGVYAFHSIYAIIGSVVLAIVCRSLFSERYLSDLLDVPRSRMVAGELAVTFVFILATLLLPAYGAATLFTCAYSVYLVANRGRLVEVIQKARSAR